MNLKDLSHIGVLSLQETEFPEVSKIGAYTVHQAIPHREPKKSLNLSMHSIMKEHRGRMIMIMEEDVVFASLDHLDQALSELPDDFELCYLGGNITDEIEGYSKHLVRCFGCWATHAVIYNCCAQIADLYDTETIFDEWLRANIHPKGNTYLVRPFMAYQQTHESSLWGAYADYNEIFNISNQKAIHAD